MLSPLPELRERLAPVGGGHIYHRRSPCRRARIDSRTHRDVMAADVAYATAPLSQRQSQLISRNARARNVDTEVSIGSAAEMRRV